MSTNITGYKLLTNIKIDDVTYTKGTVFYLMPATKYKLAVYTTESEKYILPSYVNVNDTTYFEPYTKVLKYNVEDHVIFKHNTGERHGIIRNITHAGRYYIADECNIKRYYTEDEIICMADIYYFVNSKGVICVAVKDKDKNADSWRRSIGNMFSSWDNADNYRQSLKKPYLV